MGLSGFQPTYSFPDARNTQHHDGEYIIEISNGNHICIVIQLHITVVNALLSMICTCVVIEVHCCMDLIDQSPM